MKAPNQPRRLETNCFAKKKATAPTTRLTAMEGPKPSIARVGASTSHAAREAITVAMTVGIPLPIGETRFELDRRRFQRMRERQARFDSDSNLSKKLYIGNLLAHFHEGEAARAAGLAIRDHGDRVDGPVALEHAAEFLLGGSEGEISDVKLLTQVAFLVAPR